MGEYTGLHLKCKIKRDFRDIIEKISMKKNDFYWENTGIDFIMEFAKDDRADFIPHGGLCYMPNSWEAHDGEIIFNKETGDWEFYCSLKNYSDTIENFFENVLWRLAESMDYCEVHYNDVSWSTLYSLNESGVYLELGSNEIKMYDRPVISPLKNVELYDDCGIEDIHSIDDNAHL